MSLKGELDAFLSSFRSCVKLGYVRWLKRPADRQHLTGLDITQKQALELIEELTADNYSDGPKPDDVEPGRSVWMFGADAGGVEAYIKLALQPDPKRRTVTWGLIWSFHKADHPCKYPLKINKP